MWREIAHFVGGATVRELKRRMTHREFMDWLEYFSRVGRVGPIRLYDRGPALLAWKIDQVVGGKSQMTDYLPATAEPEVEASVEDVIKAFGGVKHA